MKSSYNYSVEEKAAWLRGFFDGEGGAYCSGHSRRITVGNTDEQLIRITRKYLLDLGIVTKQYTKRRSNGNHKDLYELHIWGFDNILMFYRRVGFTATEKSDKIIKILKSYRHGSSMIATIKDFTKDSLRKSYLEEKLTVRECSDIFGLSPSSIKRWLKKWDIPTRTRKEWSNTPAHV